MRSLSWLTLLVPLTFTLYALTTACGGGGGGGGGNGSVGALCPKMDVDAATIKARALKFEADHGLLPVLLKKDCPTNQTIACQDIEPADYASIHTFLDQMDEEIDIYPDGFFDAIGLKYLVFVDKLTWTKTQGSAGGFAIPLGRGKSVILLNAEAVRYCYAPANKRIIHHEIGHSIDIGYFDALSSKDVWKSMNPPGFVYGKTDLDSTDLATFSHPYQGFVSEYGTFTPAEDFAEVYTAMHFTEVGQDLNTWAKDDKYIAAKLIAEMAGLAIKWPDFAHSLPNYPTIRETLKARVATSSSE